MTTTIAEPRIGTGLTTFGLALPQGAARDGVQVGLLLTQTDVKVRWPDGTIRFAAVSTRTPRADVYPITAGPASSGLIYTPAAWAPFVVTLTIGAETWTAELPATPTADRWLAGPVVHEARCLVAPRNVAGVGHVFLRVRFDVRMYADGGGRRISVAVENTVDVASTNHVTYNVAMSTPGATIPARLNVQHHAFSRWRDVVSVGLPDVAIVPDLEPFYLANALARPLVEGTANPVRTLGPKFEPLQVGDLIFPMAAPGGRPEIGPYPAWYFHYAAHKHPSQLAYLLKMGENVSGAISMHITNPDDSAVTLDTVASATMWTWGNGSGPKNGKQGRKYPPEIGSAHQPSMAFVPYMLTADRFYLDEMRAWAHYCFMSWGPYGRRGKEGIIAYQQTRGIGWALRDVSDFVAYAPDGDVDTPYLLAKLKNNLRELDTQAAAGTDPLGSLRPTSSYLSATPQLSQVPVWQNNYLAWGLHRAIAQNGLGPEGSAARQKLVQYQLDLFTHGPAFKSTDAAEYWYFVVRHEDGTPFKDFGELWRYNFADIVASTGKPRKETAADLLPGYAIDARLAILVAVELKLPGADAAYKQLSDAMFTPQIGIPPGWGMLDELKRRSEFAVAAFAVATVDEPTIQAQLLTALAEVDTLTIEVDRQKGLVVDADAATVVEHDRADAADTVIQDVRDVIDPKP